MKFIQYVFLFMFIQAVVIGSVIGLFADAETEHFVRTSPWILLYYGYFAFAVALTLSISKPNNG